MEMSRPLQLLRDTVAVLVTAIFMFPIFWWALTSIKPISAVFDKDRVNFFDFTPTFINYGVTLFGQSRSQIAIDEGLGMGVAGADAYDSRMSILESVIVSIGATAITMGVAVFAAYAISRMAFRGRASYLNWVLGQRFMPPIAILIPLVSIYKVAGMRDTDNLYMGYLGLMMIYALMNLPIAVLLMKSFFDDVPKDVDEAAMIDGATRWQTFRHVIFPTIAPALLTGFAMAFARGVGEYGSVIFIAGNMPMISEITPLIIIGKLEQYDYAGATAVALVMLVFSFILLLIINALQAWQRRHSGAPA